LTTNQTLLKNADREIIDGLLQIGLERRKSEDQLFTRYAYFINEGVHKFGLTKEESFDAYSDSILSAIDRIANGSFEGRSSLKTWLYQIFHNKCVDLLRKKTTNKSSIHRTLSITEMLHQVSDSTKSIIQELSERTDWDQMKEKLKQIGENCRQMLLYWADGVSDKEIAASMEYKSADVVKTSRLRCLDKLKQLFKTS